MPRPRSTKAGASTPATLRYVENPHVGPGRSTKAGASTPATQARGEEAQSDGAGRSTKAGASTPATREPVAQVHPLVVRSTKAGASTPATLQCERPHLQAVVRSTKAGASTPATRARVGRVGQAEDRSTKAGASTPATLAGGEVGQRFDTAQRRPGHQPRRHAKTAAGSLAGGGALNEGRGINPGDTPSLPPARPRTITTLNEGRGINPGDTHTQEEVCLHHARRSTKAGASTPATLVSGNAADAARKAGAQRRPGHQPRRHQRLEQRRRAVERRSTKAGASTPATLGFVSTKARTIPPALNEGRGINPGDTTDVHVAVVRGRLAQRRPGHQPRRHRTPRLTRPTATAAQRRPGHQPRRHC